MGFHLHATHHAGRAAGPQLVGAGAAGDAEGELVSAVMRSTDERYSFEFAGMKNGLDVPAGP